MTRYRQQQQVIELEGFIEGRGVEQHPDPDLWGSGWGDPFTAPILQPVRMALDAALADIKHGGHVLEIGPGGGRWTNVIAEYRSEHDSQFWLTVVDATPKSFELVNRWVLDINHHMPPDAGLICLDGGLPDWFLPCDCIFSFDVFVHFDLQLTVAYLESITRVLKPGGKLLINFACEFEGHPEWVRSDRWFEYLLKRSGDSIIYHPALWKALEPFELVGDVHDMPAGYGSAFMVLRRSD